MSLGVNFLIYLTEIASKSLSNNFLYSKVYEVHHKYKKDHPSGTALTGKGIADGKSKNFYNLIGKKYVKKNFPYGKK